MTIIIVRDVKVQFSMIRQALLVTATSDMAALLAITVAIHSIVFCRKVHTFYTKLLAWTILSSCFLYEMQNYLWYTYQSVFTKEDVIASYTEAVIISLLIIIFTQVHRLEMNRRATLIGEKTALYMSNDYHTITRTFGSNLMGLSWDYASVKNFMKKKMLVAEVLAWALFAVSCAGSLITRFGGL